MANEGRIRDDSGLPETKLDASLRGGQIVEYRPDLSSIRDPKAAHALRIAYDYIYQLRGAMFKAEDQDIPELTVPEANPFIPGGEEPPTEECEVNLIPGPGTTVMAFLFGGENAFAPGDGFLYTGNQIQGRIEIINYMGLPFTTPGEIGQYDFPGGFKNMRVAVYGDIMYVTNGDGGGSWIEILDVTDRTNPILKPRFDTFANGNDSLLVFLRNGNNTCLCQPILAGVAPVAGVLSLYSIANPLSPSTLDTISDTFAISSGINASKRGILFISSAGGAGGKLYAYDISNPTNIQSVSSVPTPNIQYRSFYQSYGHGYIYACDGPNNLIHVWDVRDPASMVEVGTGINTVGQAQTTSVDGAFLYVTSDLGGLGKLELFSLLNPRLPVPVGIFDLPTTGFYTYGLLTRDGVYTAHSPTTGLPVFCWFTIEYPVCCNCNPTLVTPNLSL